jgi:hypothetical protein
MSGKTLAEVWALGKEGQGWVRWCANTDGKGFDPKGKAEASTCSAWRGHSSACNPPMLANSLRE